MASRNRSRYFTVTAALMLVLSVVAFSDNLFTDIGQASNRDPKMVVHGLFGLAWYVLLLVQANLVRVRNLALHRKLGAATLVVALGVALSTLYLFVVLWKGWANMAPMNGTISTTISRPTLSGWRAASIMAMAPPME